MVLCEVCGAENRDRAKFCRGCTAPIAPETGPAVARNHARSLKPVCPACQANNLAGARFCQACGGPLLPASTPHRSMPPVPVAGAAKRKAVFLGLMLVALMGIGVFWWTGWRANGPITPATAPEALAQQAGGAAKLPAGLLRVDHATQVAADSASVGAEVRRPAGEVSTAENAAGVTATTEAERLRQSLDRLQREDQLRTASLAQQRATREQALRRAEQARRRAEAATVAVAVAAPIDERPVVAAAVTTPRADAIQPTTAAKTVESLCAGSGNFFARDMCRMRECGNASFAGDPTCVRFREMEESSRRALAQ